MSNYRVIPEAEWQQVLSFMADIKALLSERKEDWLTTEEACDMLSCSKRAWARYRKNYNIRISQVGRRILVARSEIERIIQDRAYEYHTSNR